jgi:hypothetical protein
MMVSHITTTIGLTLLVTSYGVQAYSTGAPELSCEDMIPLGHSIQIPDTSNNYKFSANVTRLTYCVGDEIFSKFDFKKINTFFLFLGGRGRGCKKNLKRLVWCRLYFVGIRSKHNLKCKNHNNYFSKAFLSFVFFLF